MVLALVVAGLATGCSASVDDVEAEEASTRQAAAPDPEATAVRVVRYLDQILRQALVAGDTHTVDRILSPDFVDVAEPEATLSRERYVRAVASGELDYRAFQTISPVQVRVSGRRAVVVYRAHLSWVRRGVHTERDTWQAHVFEQGGDGWREVRVTSPGLQGRVLRATFDR